MSIRIRVYPQPGSIGLRRRASIRRAQRALALQQRLLQLQLQQQQIGLYGGVSSYGYGAYGVSPYGVGQYGNGFGYGSAPVGVSTTFDPWTGYGSLGLGTPDPYRFGINPVGVGGVPPFVTAGTTPYGRTPWGTPALAPC